MARDTFWSSKCKCIVLYLEYTYFTCKTPAVSRVPPYLPQLWWRFLQVLSLDWGLAAVLAAGALALCVYLTAGVCRCVWARCVHMQVYGYVLTAGFPPHILTRATQTSIRGCQQSVASVRCEGRGVFHLGTTNKTNAKQFSELAYAN